MGWLWGSSDEKSSKPSSEDPLRDLKPDLREFLAKESPIKYSPAPAPLPTKAPLVPPISNTVPVPVTAAETEEEKPKVPPQSLYKDGRYAHLWKNYTPQSTLESEAKSDAEKINDVLEGYKYRKAEIGRAALENCALEQWEVNECFQSGGIKARLTMCRTENRQLERCYMMQSKFLKALGYLSTFERPPEVDEKIQMHADTLFHRMLDQEAAIEAAKAAGKPAPSFPPLLSTPPPASKPGFASATAAALQPNPSIKPSDLAPKVQEGFKKRLEGLGVEERAVEQKAIDAEIEAGEQLAGSLGKIYQGQQDVRAKRKETGKETVGDKLAAYFGAK